MTAQVRTLTGDKVSLSTELSELKSRLDEARVLTETNISLHRKVEDLTRENEGVVKELNFYKVKLDKAIAKCNGSIDKYNDLAKVYNKLREDYITLQGDYKILREPSTKSRVLKIIMVLLLSPLVFMLEFAIFILLFDL